MKVVLDTNILISALIKAGKPRELLLKIVEDGVQAVLSRGILEEFLEVVEDSRIRKYVDEDDIIAFLRVIGSVAKIAGVKSKFKVIKEDPTDDVVLRTAQDGKANCLVSGDKHLLSLGKFRGMKIVTADEMLKMLVRKG
jgi:putative PIN family toxin of toxin-antitoxin system